MVNIIENKAEIEGTVTRVSAVADSRGYYQVDVRLKKSRDIENMPNLAKNDEGKEVHLNVLGEQLEQLKIHPKSAIRCVVRKAFGQVYFLML